MLGKFGLIVVAVVAGAVMFTSLWGLLSWGLDLETLYITSFLGSIIGFAGSIIGSCAFRIAKRFDNDHRKMNVVRVMATVLGYIIGSALSLLLYSFIYGLLVYQRHPERSYPGDTEGMLVMFMGALIASIITYLYASGVMQSWLDTWIERNRAH